jgi:hypothetical protein
MLHEKYSGNKLYERPIITDKGISIPYSGRINN